MKVSIKTQTQAEVAGQAATQVQKQDGGTVKPHTQTNKQTKIYKAGVDGPLA